MAPERLPRDAIVKRVAAELSHGDYVNLGVGLPMLVAGHVTPPKQVVFHAENGILGFLPTADPANQDPDVFDAGFRPVSLVLGAAAFDGPASFAIIRGRHLDAAVLGGLQVSEAGDLANWMRPDRGVGSVGGAADIARGARRVYVAMEHTTRDGGPGRERRRLARIRGGLSRLLHPSAPARRGRGTRRGPRAHDRLPPRTSARGGAEPDADLGGRGGRGRGAVVDPDRGHRREPAA